MASRNNPKARNNELVVQESKGDLLLYDLNINKVYCLNPTSAAIWNLCDGKSSVSEISKELSKKLKQPVTDDLVYLALDQFKTDNLLSDNNEIEIKFGGLSRREVIRKVGFASMIALPVIISLVAPTAAMAQSAGSNLPLFATCFTSSQCASGNCATSGTAANKCCAGTDTAKELRGRTISGYTTLGTCGSVGDDCTTLDGSTRYCCSGTSYRNGCQNLSPLPNVFLARVSCACA